MKTLEEIKNYLRNLNVEPWYSDGLTSNIFHYYLRVLSRGEYEDIKPFKAVVKDDLLKTKERLDDPNAYSRPLPQEYEDLRTLFNFISS